MHSRTEAVKRDAKKYPSFEEDLRCPDFIVFKLKKES